MHDPDPRPSTSRAEASDTAAAPRPSAYRSEASGTEREPSAESAGGSRGGGPFAESAGGSRGGGPFAESAGGSRGGGRPEGRPVIAAADRRHLALPGTWNVRDVGGYRAGGGTTRWGRLLRGDSLAGLEPAGRARLAELGLRTVIDLREPGERKVAPDALDGLAVDVHLQPVVDGRVDLARAWDLAELYPLFVKDCGDALAGAVATLARPGALPALVHCTAGKDRTGLVVALALRAVGVDEDTVVADYTLTSQYYTGPVVEQIRGRLRAAGVDAEITESMFASPPELLRDALALVDADYGGVPAFLEAHGVDAAAQAALREALVEPD